MRSRGYLAGGDRRQLTDTHRVQLDGVGVTSIPLVGGSSCTAGASDYPDTTWEIATCPLRRRFRVMPSGKPALLEPRSRIDRSCGFQI